MACSPGFERHRWLATGICERCGVTRNSNEMNVNPGVIGSPFVGESMDALVSEAQQGTPKESKTAERKRKRMAEDEASRILARANARSIILTVEGAKRIAATRLLSYEGTAIKLLEDEEQELVAQLTRILEVLEWDISNPKVMLFLFLLTEVRITIRQFAAIQADIHTEVERLAKK